MSELYFLTVNYHSAELLPDLAESVQANQRALVQMSECMPPGLEPGSESGRGAGLAAGLASTSKSALRLPCHWVIVNNSPDDQGLEDGGVAQGKDWITVLATPGNLGFGQGCTVGLRWIYARSPRALVWLLNPDARLEPGAIAALDRTIREAHRLGQPLPSLLGTVIKTLAGEPWFAGGYFLPEFGLIGVQAALPPRLEWSQEEGFGPVEALGGASEAADGPAGWLDCDWVSACSCVLNLAQFASCPTFNPAYFLYYEDFEFCRRYALQGHRIVMLPTVEVRHDPSSITNRNPRQKLRHSTMSYLMTQEQFSPRSIVVLRVLRLIAIATLFLVVRPRQGLGKWQGLWEYYRNRGRRQAAVDPPPLESPSLESTSLEPPSLEPSPAPSHVQGMQLSETFDTQGNNLEQAVGAADSS